LASKAQQLRGHWADEMDGAAMYRALAERADGEQREIFLELAAAEERHAAHWAAKLVELGEPAPRPEEHHRRAKARLVAWLARRFGTRAVLPIVERAEIADAGDYDGVPDATRAMATDERIHARVLAGLTPSMARAGGSTDRRLLLLAGLPWLLASGAAAFVASLALSASALFLVGAGISLLTGRSPLQSGARQLLVALAAAAATFGIGRMIGVSVS
jgi:rubrerythrin